MERGEDNPENFGVRVVQIVVETNSGPRLNFRPTSAALDYPYSP